jgi:hypothetical protein
MIPSLSRLVIDGANRIGEHTAVSPLAPLAFLGAAVLTALALRWPSRGAHAVGVAAIICAALPGFSTFAAQRPSSPLQGTTAAAVVERFRAQVQGFAEEHQCAAVRASACVACDPVVDFALATVPPCATPAAIVLGPDALTAGCVESGGTLSCGGVPGR